MVEKNDTESTPRILPSEACLKACMAANQEDVTLRLLRCGRKGELQGCLVEDVFFPDLFCWSGAPNASVSLWLVTFDGLALVSFC